MPKKVNKDSDGEEEDYDVQEDDNIQDDIYETDNDTHTDEEVEVEDNDTEYNITEYTPNTPAIDKSIELKGNDRITRNILSKYEMVRILGERIKQLSMGAKALVKNVGDLSYENIAIEELKMGMIPFKIKRALPNGKYEYWSLKELSMTHLLSHLES